MDNVPANTVLLRETTQLKKLTIILDDITLYEGPVSEINFIDGEARVGIQGDKPKAAAPQVGSLLSALASARRQPVAQQVEEVE